jgi:hypothetical protein
MGSRLMIPFPKDMIPILKQNVLKHLLMEFEQRKLEYPWLWLYFKPWYSGTYKNRFKARGARIWMKIILYRPI